MRLKAGMGALLASDKIDQTALRQGTALRLPETVGNIIFHPRPGSRSFALAHKETRTGANQLLLASAKGQQRHLSHSLVLLPQSRPALLNAGKGEFILSTVFASEI